MPELHAGTRNMVPYPSLHKGGMRGCTTRDHYPSGQMDEGNDTDPDLRECIYEFAMGRGGVLMENICQDHGYNKRYVKMATAQDW
jgi:hypothetical protein